MKEKKIKVGDFFINYKEFFSSENSENIVILHGWQGSSDSWISVGEKLNKKNFNVIIPDIPCASKKTDCKKIFSLQDYAILIENFLEKLNLDNIILWGHSNGGAISIKISNRKKIKILRLILNNSAGIRNDQKRSLKRKIFKLITSPLAPLLKGEGNKWIKKLRELFYRAIGGQDYLHAEKNPNLKQTYLNMINSDLKEEIKKIEDNALLIWGKLDNYTPVSDAFFMRNNIKNSKLVVLDGETHGIHLKNPDRLVKTFLKEI